VDCFGGMTSLSHNIDGSGTCNLTGPGDMPSTVPMVAPLADNGGPTLTHVLDPGSPAIDAAVGTACPDTDQRGVSCPQGAACYIGSFELEPATPVPAAFEWALMALAASLAGLAFLLARRRTLAANESRWTGASVP